MNIRVHKSSFTNIMNIPYLFLCRIGRMSFDRHYSTLHRDIHYDEIKQKLKCNGVTRKPWIVEYSPNNYEIVIKLERIF